MTKQEFINYSIGKELGAVKTDGEIIKIKGVDTNENSYIYFYWDSNFIRESIFDIDFKLILHPLSDLTKPITHKGETFIPIVELAKISGFIEDSNENHIITDTGAFTYKVYCDGDVDFTYDSKHNCFIAFDKESYLFIQICNQLDLFLKLIEWKFNLMDEADGFINVNDLDVNPYK